MIGTTVSHYRILEEIGAGGMGVVYKATDLRLGRTVALKFLPPGITRTSEAKERFSREARAASTLDHPNVCTIYEIDETDDHRIFFAMAFYAGETLRQRIERGPLPLGEAVRIVREVGSGLARAHRAGIVHRDIKPANVMLTGDSEVKILDFGLAKLAEDRTLTRAGAVMGSPPYMSPEQVRGDTLDHRTDIWSLGVVLFELITGELPFRGSNDQAVLHSILHDPVPTIEAPPDPAFRKLKLSLEKALQKDPAGRYQRMEEWLSDLEQISGEFPRTASASELTVRRPAQPGEETSPSVAVLPFADMSPSRDQEYFCDGVAEEILNALTRLEGLQVASRTSSFQFRGASEDIRKIGERLNVKHILEGSVRKSGQRVRVTVQLIKVADGYHFWSERYDGDLEDIFAIQDSIAEKTARALKVLLTGQAVPAAPRTNVEAYEFYLRGRKLVPELQQRSLRLAKEMFKRAVEIDPNYALGHAGVADASSWLYMWFGGSPADLRQADESSRKALELAPDFPEAHVSRAFALMIAKRYDESQAEFERAISIDPKNFDACYGYGRMAWQTGNLEKAAELFRRAAEARPDDYQSLGLRSQVLRDLGRDDQADRADEESHRRIERRLEIAPLDARAWYMGANMLRRRGQIEKAEEWIQRSLTIDPEDPAIHYNAACFYARINRSEQAFDHLERAFARQAGFSIRDWAEHDSDLDSLRHLPEFQRLMQQLP